MESNISSTRKTVESDLRQLVCFQLEKEDFGIDINNVKEIIRMTQITKIPQAAKYVEGVINLRGKIIPVINLRNRFHLEEETRDEHARRIVIIETKLLSMGIVVDAVTEVLRISSSTIEPAPDIVLSGIETRYIEGVAMLANERLLIVLDSDKLFTESEQKKLSSIRQAKK